MKMSFFTSLLLASMVITFSQCTKEKTEPPTQDSLENTVWTGEFKYNSPGHVPESYSISFNDRGGFEWEELSKITKGAYSLGDGGKKVVLTFSDGAVIEADVTEHGTMMNFQSDASYGWTILNGKLNTTTEQDLLNSVWKDVDNNKLRFLSASSLNVYGYPANFTRTKGGIKFTIYSGFQFKFFLVPDGNTLKGIFMQGDGFDYKEQKLTKM